LIDASLNLPNALPFSGVGAAQPAPRFYVDVAAATTSALQRLGDAWRYPWNHKVKVLKWQKIAAT